MCQLEEGCGWLYKCRELKKRVKGETSPEKCALMYSCLNLVFFKMRGSKWRLVLSVNAGESLASEKHKYCLHGSCPA